ncbi:MAG: ribonuclease H-like domain-containing protein [Deltaproteobacteria bacterium]|nr:ribonuclease H-like domain-containing protein [Deltaproteobacteria bacterium]
MLPYTFCHLKGIGKNSENRLWHKGIVSWDDFDFYPGSVFSERKTELITTQLKQSRAALSNRDCGFFLDRLPPGEQVRVFPHFRSKTAFVDIETTGLSTDAEITTIALYDGSDIKTYQQDRNIEEFIDDIENHELLVTYNGKRFDLPFMRKFFGRSFDIPHIDLCPILRGLGYRGGLKRCEKLLGIKRQVPEEIDGRVAVYLWHRYRCYDDTDSLRLLLAYNCQDVLSLEILMIMAYNRVMEDCPVDCSIRPPVQPRLSW